MDKQRLPSAWREDRCLTHVFYVDTLAQDWHYDIASAASGSERGTDFQLTIT